MKQNISIPNPVFYLKYFIARYLCVTSLERGLSIYSWLWLLLPNWRYYLRQKYSKTHKRFGKYSDMYVKPDRIRLWKVNGFKYKFKIRL